MFRRHTFVCRTLIVLVLTVILGSLAQVATADAVYLKDGFALHGKVRREADVIYDPVTGTPLPVFKGNFFVVDDRVRWVIFDHRNVQDANPDLNIRRDFLEFVNTLPSGQANKLPKMARVVSDGKIDAKWQRIVKLQDPIGTYAIRQRLTQLNAYSAKFESNTYQWNEFYLTQELGLDTVMSLLDSHPDLKEGETPDIERRMKRFRFLMQANWLIAAEKELDRALTDLPSEKDRIERSRKALKQAEARAIWDEAETSNRAGRHLTARSMLKRISANETSADFATRVAALKNKYESAEKRIAQSKTVWLALTERIPGPQQWQFADSWPVIESALSVETIDRLDSFLTLAGQTEQQLATGTAPTYSIESVLSLAVTGFVLGNAAADPNVKAAERAWSSREFALTYLKMHDPTSRKQLLESYQVNQPLSQDEFLQMISLLPPAEPANLTGPTLNGVQDRQTAVPWSRNRATHYSLQLPIEYHHDRSWPVLIVLPSAGERPIDALAPWAYFALQQGYILASPLRTAGAEAYSYTSEEQVPVLELIQDLRRRFNVDSDRVFLAGYNDGGTMATDLGLAHPDLFAGIVTMNARPRVSASKWYWHNAQYLPFYIVAGELAGDCLDKNRGLFQNWMNKGYPSLMTIYKGRPSEFYRVEPTYAFDWMNRKKRAAGFPELGRSPNAGPQSEEFVTARHGDNRFYWLEAVTINDKYTTTTIGSGGNYTPAALQATIRDGNHIAVNTRGIRKLRVWLGKASDLQGGWRSMIDFSKPVRITANRQVWTGKDIKVTPSLGVMMEDLYLRGDRQRPMFASIELNGLQ